MPARLQNPIVLAHGLLGFAKLAVGEITLASYFRGIPEFLRSSGNRVILTAVPPTGSIASRAEALKRQIEVESPEEPVHIIGHSMGGLDARHMIAHLGMAGRVLSLTTLGTPHRGSPFADWTADFCRKLGIFGLMHLASIDQEAFEDLRVASCAKFNERTPDAPQVRYFSVGGAPPPERLLFALRMSSRIIEPVEGPNDGFVSLASARWGEAFEVWDCDHVNMVGWSGPMQNRGAEGPSIFDRYAAIVERLADIPGR